MGGDGRLVACKEGAQSGDGGCMGKMLYHPMSNCAKGNEGRRLGGVGEEACKEEWV